MKKTRTESDSLGSVKVPKDAYYGAQTQRSLLHFPGKETMPIEVIHALALIKKCAALTHRELKQIDPKRARWIVQSCQEVLEGKWDAHFPLKVWQTGSGTQTNMNVNEVIANRAIELAGGVLGSKNPIHPNDHVNKSQSSNDTFPTAMHIASALTLNQKLLPSLLSLHRQLKKKMGQFQNILKIGRTHLQDATPMTLGQQFSGYISLIERDIERILSSSVGLYELALGGTAVGTGLNTHPLFAKKTIEKIASFTHLPFRPHPNLFAALSSHDELVYFSGSLKTLATSLIKIANDVRWLGSGPRCGLQEFILPSNEPGSSIMPGKVNPTQCEALIMACFQVIGNDLTLSLSGSQGNFELNVCKPVMIFNLLQSIDLLSEAMGTFELHCLRNLKVNRSQTARYVNDSLMLITALTPRLGYDLCAQVAHLAHTKNISLKEACLELGVLKAKEFDSLVNPMQMAYPHKAQ